MSALDGLRVLVPRAESSAAGLLDLLREKGAAPVSVPLIAMGGPTDQALFDLLLHALCAGDYDWVAFTSANAVQAVVDRARSLRLDPVVPPITRIAAVGPATAAAIREAGLPVDLEPPRSGGAAALLEHWPPAAAPGSRVLLPTSAIGLTTLADGLTAKGYRTERIQAYLTAPMAAPPEVIDELRRGCFGAVLLTSGSTAGSLAAQVQPAPEVLIGCIGPTTAAAARHAGLRVAFTATEATATGLVAALAATLKERSPR